MMSSGVSRRKQARPQKVFDDKDTVGLLNGGSGEMGASDCHVCGVCSGQFTTIHTFLAHKQSCFPETPVDLTNKTEPEPLQDSDTKSSIYDESSGAELGSDLMCMYCMCGLPSQGALLWHTVSIHAEDMPLECILCQEQFSTPKQLVSHCTEAHKELTDADLDRPKSCPPPTDLMESTYYYNRYTDSAPPADIMTDLYAASVDRLMLQKLNYSRSSSRSGLVIAEHELNADQHAEAALDLSSPGVGGKVDLINQLLASQHHNSQMDMSNLYNGKMPLPFSLNSIMSNGSGSSERWSNGAPKPSNGSFDHTRALFRPQLMPPDLPSGLNFGMAPVTSQSIVAPTAAPYGSSTAGGDPSNDDDWESMMEVSNVDENEKIRQLVGDKAAPVTDPNQCILCRRILSCKSALQMHYRTHTGERPFKCKICQRAFTTKGNLKTHMGVHRSKHPFRMFHQCPICQKRFFTAQLLQQHIRMHTSQLTASAPPPHHLFHGPPPTVTNGGQAQMNGHHHRNSSTISNNNNDPLVTIKHEPVEPKPQPQNEPAKVVESPVRPPTKPTTPVPVISTILSNGSTDPHRTLTSTISLPTPMNMNIFLQSQPTMADMNKFLPPHSSATLHSHHPSTSFPRLSDAKEMPNLSPLPNTTCNICYKVFACNSALEIHYRSHTKERPFKCTACNRGFSTKGNMKQHMLTHKIRDMTNGCDENENEPAVVRSTSSSFSDDSHPPCSTMAPAHSPPPPQQQPAQLFPSPVTPIATPMDVVSREDKPIVSPFNPDPPTPVMADTNPLDAIRKMWDRTETSPPKKTPQLAKHQCGVCFKHFSSSSALQIHMRTHTGDKPFKCPVCSRAFTTKGNLKVHMGTHMTVNPSRRGRRIFDLSSGPQFSPFGQFRSGLALPLMGLAPTSQSQADAFQASFRQREGGRGTEESEQSSPASSLGQPESTNRSPTSNGSSDPDANALSKGSEGPRPDLEALLRAAAGSSMAGGGRLPLGPFMPGMEGGPGAGGLDTMMWMWRHVCSVCHKICQGSAQLEEHLKTHLNAAQSIDNKSTNTAVA